MTSFTEPKKSRRINFLPKTKLLLAKRAGLLCSFPGCLIHTTGLTLDDEGEDSAAGIAVAAHIYPASENGPRKREGLTEEQISNVSNGIWLCRTHGTLIDEFQVDYPPETVLEMKAVREYAQALTIKAPEIAFFVGWTGVKRLDAIVWKHWPNPDDEMVRLDMVSEGLQLTPTAESPLGAQMPVPPTSFEFRPLYRVTTSIAPVSLVMGVTTRLDNYPAERRRAVAIVSSWGKLMKRWGWDGKGALINHGYVKITARDSETGAFAEQFVWARGRTACVYDYNVVTGEQVYLDIDHTAHRASNLDWHLNIAIRDGECRTESILRMWRPITPRNSHEYTERAEIEAYAQVLERLASGWEPFGFVGLEAGEWSDPESAHPEGFAIRCAFSEEQLNKAIDRCTRVRLGYELADIWDLGFYFTDEFFSEALDEQTIRKASEGMLAKLGPAPYPIFDQSEQIVALNNHYGIRLTIKQGKLFFEQVRSRNPPPSPW